jgi:tetratricopeptide (TPR) repeat protein
MHNCIRIALTLIASVCLQVTLAHAAAGEAVPWNQQSDSATSQGLAASEAAYNAQIEGDPSNIALRLERAHVLAWQKKYEAAKRDYQAVLQADPQNIAALNGLGYTLAWSGDYAGAEQRFRQTLAIVPGQSDATKGLAYVALWRGDAQTAVQRFQLLAETMPNDAEIQLAMGQAEYAAGRLPEAREAFRRVLALDSNNRAAQEGVLATQPRPGAQPGIRASSRPLMELSLWGGPSFLRSPGLPAQNDAGFRFAEVAVWPMENVRLSFQYDNGLSLDNPSLVLAGKTVPAYFVGGLVNWKRNYLSRFEVGWRELPGNVRQTIYRGEQVFFLPRGYSLKAGGWIGPREDKRTEWLTHTSVSVPLGERLRVEPTLFYSRSGLPGEREWRLWAPVEYSFANRWAVGGGIAGGQMFTGPSSLSHGVWDGSLRVSAPLGSRTRSHVMFRHEAVSGGSSITILSFGLSFEIAGR